jgi:hypothetical protein
MYEMLAKPLIGAALGGVNALFGGGGFKGKKAQPVKISPFSSTGQQGLDWLVNQGQQNADFGGIEDRYRKQFNEQTIPSLAERFTGMGSGAQESSAFQSSLGRAGSDLESQLAALRSQYGLQQMQTGLRPQYEVGMEAAKPGFLQGAFRGAMGGSGGPGGIMESLSGMFGGQGGQQGQFGNITGRDKQMLMKLIQFLHAGGSAGQGGL